jgi:acetyl-CoA carboxylase biotin carboxyl carrier protein
MDLKLLQKLIRIMKSGDLTEIEVEEKPEGMRIHLSRRGEPAPAAPVLHVVQAPASPSAAPANLSAATAPAAASGGAPPKSAGQAITSPMVGTFYRAPSPDAEPFVSVGTRIKPDARLCIIEAMKVMNEIKAEVAGEVLEILVENGEPVEFGQPLFLVKLD